MDGCVNESVPCLEEAGRSPGLPPPADPAPPLQSVTESEMAEIITTKGEIDWALRYLRSWMKDEKVSKNLVSRPGVGWAGALRGGAVTGQPRRAGSC